MSAELTDGAVATAKIYVASSCCSLVCCSLVLLLHARSRRLSRFPSSIMLWRIVCDSLLCVQLIVLNAQVMTDRDEQTLHNGDGACGPKLAFLAQVALFGSLGWYACLALNLYLSVTRPFTRPPDRMGLFHTWVWLGAAGTGALAASRHGYRPLYQLCWIKPPPGQQVDLYNWALLGGWVVTYPVLSTLGLAYCEWVTHFDRHREQITSRLRPRLVQLRASRLATVIFSLFWGGLGAAYLYLYFTDGRDDPGYAAAARHTFALFIGLLGTCDAGVWLAVQLALNRPALAIACGHKAAAISDATGSDETRRAERAREDDLSDALRRELIRNTIVGVVTSTRTANAEAISVYPAREGERAIWVPRAPKAGGGKAPRLGAEGDCCGGARGCCCGLGGLCGLCDRRYARGWAALTWARNTRLRIGRHGISLPHFDQLSLSDLAQPLLPAGHATPEHASRNHAPTAAPAAAPAAATAPAPAPAPSPAVAHAAAAAPNAHAGAAHTAAPAPAFTNAPAAAPAPSSCGRFGRFTTSGGGFKDAAIPQLTRSHFNEVWTLQIAHTVFFQDFAPMVWQALRQLVFHVSFKSYLFSLEGDGQLELFLDQMVGNFSEGRSGGFFFTSADKRYLVKTLTRTEQRRLLHILPRYYEYLRSHPRSLLSRFYGCYCITMHGQSRYFAVIENVFHGADAPIPDLERYDLKGSWLSRTAKPGARTRLDCDMKRPIGLPADVGVEVAAQCASDAEMLRSLGVMDYSLLVGIERKQNPRGSLHEGAGAGMTPAALCTEPRDPRLSWSRTDTPAVPLPPDSRAPLPSVRPRAGSASERRLRGPIAYSADPESEPGVVYYLAIIDLLQAWDWSKRIEHWLKILLYCRCCGRNAIGMSAVEPGTYARRFVGMIRRVMEREGEAGGGGRGV